MSERPRGRRTILAAAQLSEERLADRRREQPQERDPRADHRGEEGRQELDREAESSRHPEPDPDALGDGDQVDRLDDDEHRAEQELGGPDRAGLDETRRRADDVDGSLRGAQPYPQFKALIDEENFPYQINI